MVSILRKNIISKILAFTMATSLMGPKAFATSTCENVFNGVPEFEIKQAEVLPSLNVTYRRIFHDRREFRVSEVLGKTDDLLLGIEPHGHAYVVSGDVRLDGNIIGFKTTAFDHMADLDTGIIIKIKKTDFDRQSLKKYNDTYGLSCGKTACDAMAKMGDLYIGANKSTYYSPYDILQAIFKGGIQDGAGNPVPFEIYYIGKFDLPNTVRRVQESSNRIKNEAVVKVGVIGTGITAITGSLLYFLGFFDDDKDKNTQ